MQLWTIQPIEWYQKLLKDGSINGEQKWIEAHSLHAYHWLMTKMDERIGKRSFPECYPIWAWYQYKNHIRPKPDLRSRGFLPKGAKGVRLELNKYENEVLLSDFDLWHYPLNYWKINDTQKEADEFEHKLEKNNINLRDKEACTDEVKFEIEESWNKIFDMNYAPVFSADSFEKKSIQATFWTLSVSEIVKVEEFTFR